MGKDEQVGLLPLYRGQSRRHMGFWGAVGEVSYERGFKAGNAIINGRSDPLGAIGGGICTMVALLLLRRMPALRAQLRPIYQRLKIIE